MVVPANAERFDIEIDRGGLLAYLRWSAALSLIGVFIFFGGMFGIAVGGDAIKKDGIADLASALPVVLRFLSLGLGGGFLFALICYLIFFHWRSITVAQALSLHVDGMFLRIVRGGLLREDRKIHFSMISDYAVVDGPLMRRFGILAISINGVSGRPNPNMIILGVIDAPRIRDLLCEIDRAREDRKA
jgi:membrane protein YdbS with pleckstrin-like domain